MKRKENYINVTIFMKGEKEHRRQGRNKGRRNRGSPSNAQKCSTELNWARNAQASLICLHPRKVENFHRLIAAVGTVDAQTMRTTCVACEMLTMKTLAQSVPTTSPTISIATVTTVQRNSRLRLYRWWFRRRLSTRGRRAQGGISDLGHNTNLEPIR